MPDNTNNYVQTIGLDFTDAVKNAQLFDKTLTDVGNKLVSFQKTIDIVNNKTKTTFTMETGAGEIKKIISDLETGTKSITTTTNVMKNAVSAVNALYAQQKNLITERAALEKRSLSSGENETSVIRRRIEYLDKELVKIQKKIETEFDGYRNAEKELKLKELQTKHTFQQEKEEGRLNDQRRERSNLEKNILDTVVKMATVYATMKLRQMFNEAINYATKYYDLLNEIRIVSGTALNPDTGNVEASMSVAKAEEIGQAYRNIAKEMRVSSVEIAQAAVEFWRQGLPEEEVEARLQSTIRYAKISGLEFQKSAELITSATNAMEVSAERAADVFAYLGDASAAGKQKLPELIAI